MKLPLSTIVSFLLDNPLLTFTEASRKLRIPYCRVRKAAEQASIGVMDHHATRREAIVSLIKANPDVPYHQLGKTLGLKFPTLSSIASKAGIYRHVPRNPAATKEREDGVLCSLKEGRTFWEAARENKCSRGIITRVAKVSGIQRPGCSPLSYTKDQEEKVVNWLVNHPSVSHPRIGKKVGLPFYTVSNISYRNGIRRRLPSLYKGEVPNFE